MKIQVSLGEVVDKLTILTIKKEKIQDIKKLENINKEYHYLENELNNLGFTKDHPKFKELLEVNSKLWDVEDHLRDFESQKVFESDFISLARQVYIINDKRAKIKKEINIEYDSTFVEEKSYNPY